MTDGITHANIPDACGSSLSGSPCAVPHDHDHDHDPAGSPCGEGTCAPGECLSEPRADAMGQPCPTPLMWQQVLESFREQATPWMVQQAGREIRGRTFGEGPPIYFLNGVGGTHELFALTAWLLKPNFRCLLFDLPSPVRATSSIPGTSPRLAGAVDDLFAIADQQGDARFSIYAAGFGGTVTLAAMLRSPERIERAVLQGTSAHVALSLSERVATRLARWLPGRLKRIPGRSTIQQQSHRPWFPPFDFTRWQFFTENTGEVKIATLAGRAGALSGTDLRPQLPHIRTPILILGCEGEGRIAAAANDELEKGLPNARKEWMFGCGHLPFLTHPHRLAKLLEPFLGDDRGTAG